MECEVDRDCQSNLMTHSKSPLVSDPLKIRYRFTLESLRSEEAFNIAIQNKKIPTNTKNAI